MDKKRRLEIIKAQHKARQALKEADGNALDVSEDEDEDEDEDGDMEFCH